MRNWPMIAKRLEGERLMTLEQAARLLPTGQGAAGHVSAQALHRWIVRGKRGCYLDAIKPGAGWLTSAEAIGRFSAELSRMEVA